MAIYIMNLSPVIEMFSGYGAQPIKRATSLSQKIVQILHSAKEELHPNSVCCGAPLYDETETVILYLLEPVASLF